MKEFKPSKWRYVVLTVWTFFISAVPTISIISYITNGRIDLFSQIGLLTGITIFSAIFSYPLQRWLSIVISNGEISGPIPSYFRGFRRGSFLIKDVDREQSKKQSFIQKMLGYRYICSVKGGRLVWNTWAFRREQRAEILKALQIIDSAR